MKHFALKPIRFDEKELKTDLGKGNFIFVGSSTDMFAEDVSRNWIVPVLNRCLEFDNTYLFQSKNPERFNEFSAYPDKVVFGTTIESNIDYEISKAPKMMARMIQMAQLRLRGFRTMVTLEPILEFDLNALTKMIEAIRPEWVNIGADSKGHNLPEPSYEKIMQLFKNLKTFTTVKQKRSLGRLNALIDYRGKK
jgi:DNA repair photolyase